MEAAEWGHLVQVQSGVISRRQVIARGGTDNDLTRMVRRRDWFRVLDGVYVNHNGPLSWEQCAWVAVLYHWPAALAGESALIAHGLRVPRFLARVPPGAPGVPAPGGSSGQPWPQGPPIEVAVDATRSPDRKPGIRLHRIVGFEDAALMAKSPPRVRVEHAVLDVAARAPDETGAVAVLSDSVQSRRTTPGRLLDALEGRPRLRHRKFLRRLLADIATGAWSVLEHRYLVEVERRHRLPTAKRQGRERRTSGVVFRDVDYPEYGVLVELDGRLGHEWSDDGCRDLDRDIDALTDPRVTVRARWRQVLTPCRLAAALARILWSRGWTGVPSSCGPRCAVGAVLRSGGQGNAEGNSADSA
ncbi:hypothetical protein [Nocardioides sp. Root140]|uniref:hypothetical protein n=1 Tax=Nocardioides sp. Root140 TaxID=1736460 RepID=UPI0006F6D403|nr:hypothetical protein [Nocardioides sp. Root140]KQY56718.1 hypothetical protein ASD30_10415 [Nocardioides sp. Root140]